jgi:hypothetical protein
MTPLTQTPAAKPLAASPGLLRWLGVHGVLVGMAVLLIQAFPSQGLAWVVVGGPFGLGVFQATVLRRLLPFWAVILWPLATASGFVLSMPFAWFLYHFLGLGFGLGQAGLLAAGGIRGWLLWPVISGASWFSGLMTWGLGIRKVFPQDPTDRATDGLTWVWVLLVYALGTGLALRWMGRRPTSVFQ